MSLCDLVKTVVDWLNDSDNVPNYQLISPIVLLISAVSVCVCVCACVRVCMCVTSDGSRRSHQVHKSTSIFPCIRQYTFYCLSHVGTNDSSDNK